MPLALLMLDATGYVPNSLVQPRSAVWGIRILTGPIPAALLCVGIVFALAYPLTRERFVEVCQELEARRSALKQEVT